MWPRSTLPPTRHRCETRAEVANLAAARYFARSAYKTIRRPCDSDGPAERRGAAMGVISPWHSAKSDVHHNNSRCTIGNDIEREYIRNGTGDKPLCSECKKLAEIRSAARTVE